MCGQPLKLPMSAVWPVSVLRFWISEGLTQAESEFTGWNSHVHREFPGCVESTDLSGDNLSREIERTCCGGVAAAAAADLVVAIVLLVISVSLTQENCDLAVAAERVSILKSMTC